MIGLSAKSLTNSISKLKDIKSSDLFLMLFFVLDPVVNLSIFLLVFIKEFRKISFFKPRVITILFIVFFITNTLSVFVAENVMASMIELATWSFFILIFLYSSNRPELLKEGVQYRYLIYGGVLLAVFEILSVYLPSIIDSLSFIIKRPSINHVATILMILLALTEYRRWSKGTSVVVSLIHGSILLFGLWCTESRGCLALIIIYMIYLIVIKYQLKVERVFFLLFCFVGIIIVYSAISSGTMTRLNKLISSIWNPNSNNVRRVIYTELFTNTMNDHFWLGVGLRNFVDQYAYFKSINFTAAHAHSIYLQTFVEAGVIGLTGLLSFVIGIIVTLLYKIKKKININVNRLLLECTALFFTYALVECVWDDSRPGILFFILIGQVIAKSPSKYKTTKISGENHVENGIIH